MPARLSIRTKIVGSVLLVGAGALLTAIVSVQEPLRNFLRTVLAEEDAKIARILAAEVARSPGGLASSAAVASRSATILAKRVTVIAANGAVLVDTQADAGHLENHGTRPEIVQARSGEHSTGSDVRTSASLATPFLYVAARIDRDGATLGYFRLATPLDEVDAAVGRLRHAILAAALVAAAIAIPAGALAASLATRKIAAMAAVADQIGHGELGRRIEVPGDDEVGRLGHAVNLLAERLEEKLVRLTRDRALFVAVLDAVGEGLAFVDETGMLLASNGSFRRLTATGSSPEGLRLRDVLPDPALDEAIHRALDAGKPERAHASMGTPSRDVQFRILPVMLANLGSVALLITEGLSPSPRLDALRVEAAAILTRSLGNANLLLPREGVLALELSRAATLLDEPAAPPELVLLGELLPRMAGAGEAPAVYVVRSRAEAGIRLLRLEAGAKDDEPLRGSIEVEAGRVALVIEPPSSKTSAAWTTPRTSESFGLDLKAYARRLALVHLEAAGAEIDEQPKRLVIGMPRA